MTALHVACGARRDYAPHSAAMLHSVVTSSPELDVTVHYLHGPDLRRRDLERLRRTAGDAAFDAHEVPPERIAGLRGAEHIAATAWYRLLLGELLPDVARLLYLDVDTIAVRSLRELAELDLQGAYVAGVENVWAPWMTHFPAKLGLPAGQGYFNSGVLVMDLDRIRADGRDTEMLELARSGDERITWLDQDVLNAVLGHRRLTLEPRFNAMNSLEFFAEEADAVYGPEAAGRARREPIVRHFEGPGANKPWHRRCPYPDRALYSEHRRASAFGRALPFRP